MANCGHPEFVGRQQSTWQQSWAVVVVVLLMVSLQMKMGFESDTGHEISICNLQLDVETGHVVTVVHVTRLFTASSVEGLNGQEWWLTS